ncbi:MAG: NAD(P)-dependent alcohol dehydrogenase [Patescibacteria group bacterium]
MKAYICTGYGGPEKLQLVETSKPIPADSEILIRIKATAINSGDVRIRRADPWLVRLMFGFQQPRLKILGMSFAGVVEQVGKNVQNYKPGDEVFGLSESKMGTYAEYLAIDNQAALTLKPANVSFEEAVAIPFGAHTALHFSRQAELKPGQNILIYGASGAVGTALIQMAKHSGARVTAVCSTSNLEMVQKLGADEVVDYTQTKLGAIQAKFEVVCDTTDKVAVQDLAQLVTSNGTLILVAALIRGALQGMIVARRYRFKLIVGTAKVTAQDMEYIAKMTQEGQLKPVIDRVYPFNQMIEAQTYVETGHKRGNVVMKVG